MAKKEEIWRDPASENEEYVFSWFEFGKELKRFKQLKTGDKILFKTSSSKGVDEIRIPANPYKNKKETKFLIEYLDGFYEDGK